MSGRQAVRILRHDLEENHGEDHVVDAGELETLLNWAEALLDVLDSLPPGWSAPIEPDVDERYCSDCEHPHGYHDTKRGCTMPLGPTGLPLGRNEAQSKVCGCGAPTEPDANEREALSRTVLSGLRDAWRDDYSAESVASTVAANVLAAGYRRTQGGDA